MKRNKKFLEFDENLNYKVDYVYYDALFDYCDHSIIARDARDNIYKCIKSGCWKQFWFKNLKQFKRFSPHMVEEFNFEKSELLYKKQLKKEESLFDK